MTQPAIDVCNLHKSYASLKAVDDLSFDVRPGEVFSLLGPNGAGKTTTLSMLSGLLRPDQGDALIMGHSLRRAPMAVRACLGVVPQDIAVYEDLTASENLAFWGKMYGLRGVALRRRMEAVLEIIGLSDRRGDRVGKYSGGMKRRLNIGIALLHKPQVIYMDEPTVGIDPQSRRSILDSVLALKDEGVTILYTTHYMEEAQELSDRIAIMDNGRLMACGTHAELIKIVGELDRITLGLSAGDQHLVTACQSACQAVEEVQHITAHNSHLSLLVGDSNLALPRLFDAANQVGVRIQSVEIQAPNLEAVFLHLTGRALRDEERK